MLLMDVIIHKRKVGEDDNILAERESYVGTGHVEFAKSRICGVPVLILMRTATRAVPT